MKHIPVYFPMTYLPAAGLNRLAAGFGKTRVYRPADSPLPAAMQAAADQGRLDIATPPAAETDNLAARLETYYAWAAENKGVDLAALKGREAGIPFFGETSVSGIRQNIREMNDPAGRGAKPDPLMEARLFLTMAQELDRQDSELEQSLDNVRAKEDSMMSALLGDADNHRAVEAAMPDTRAADPGAYMTGSRLKAWWQLARQGTGPGNLLVTDSRAVCDFLVERYPGLQRTCPQWVLPRQQPGQASPAAWQAQLLDYLAALIATRADVEPPVNLPAVAPEGPAIHLSTYRLVGLDVSALFAGLDATGSTAAAPGGADNLVICLIVTDGDGGN